MQLQERNMSELMRSGPVFLIIYLGPLLLTYLLPYLGSNSTLINLLTLGFNPAFWLHFLACAALVVIAYLRGVAIEKEGLAVLPLLAFVFDLAPILNWIPLVPSVFHLAAIVVGVSSTATITTRAFQIKEHRQG